MSIRSGCCFILCSIIIFYSCRSKTITTDILIIQAGTGGTAAAIAAARMGKNVVLTEPSTWLGGMLTAAGVSATDGNHQLPSGIWGEFRDSLENRYGGKHALATGWVSNTLFEPRIGHEIFYNIASALPSLQVLYQTEWKEVKKINDQWIVTCSKNGKIINIKAKILIDGTDMGDVAAHIGVPYDLGMDAKSTTGETIALDTAIDIIQDFTFAAILKEYPQGHAPLIKKPEDYDPAKYHCSCDTFDCTLKTHPCATMLSYGRLPNNKYMINWPIYGNDYYYNLVESTNEERNQIIDKAKNHTLGFLYYIQNELGFKNLGIADDEFPTADGLPFMPYYREGRRIKGLVQMNMNHAERPFDQSQALYRTGIAVGDYPIDHHHGKNAKVPKLDYVPIPSFNIPAGALIPQNVDNFIMAEKAISVTNIMNGATRLQPVVLQIGQAAGTLAAICIDKKIKPVDVDIRTLQSTLLESKVYLMPYLDVPKNDSSFNAIQRIGATGILRGKGIPYKWANQTWFYPDSTITKSELQKGINSWHQDFTLWRDAVHEKITGKDLKNAIDTLATLCNIQVSSDELHALQDDTVLTRKQIAVFIDNCIHPFERGVDWMGRVVDKE